MENTPKNYDNYLKEINRITDRHFAKTCNILNQNKTEVTQVIRDAVGKQIHFLKQDLYKNFTGRDFIEDFGNGKTQRPT